MVPSLFVQDLLTTDGKIVLTDTKNTKQKNTVTSLQQELENLCPPKRRQDLHSPMCSGWFSMPLQCWLEQTDDFTPLGHHGQPGVSKSLFAGSAVIPGYKEAMLQWKFL